MFWWVLLLVLGLWTLFIWIHVWASEKEFQDLIRSQMDEDRAITRALSGERKGGTNDL